MSGTKGGDGYLLDKCAQELCSTLEGKKSWSSFSGQAGGVWGELLHRFWDGPKHDRVKYQPTGTPLMLFLTLILMSLCPFLSLWAFVSLLNAQQPLWPLAHF